MLQIGWASCDLTPEKPVVITGQFHARVSEGVLDPITATALALESVDDAGSTQVILVSCDLVTIPDSLRGAVREEFARILPDVPALDVILNATHTHTAPEVRVDRDAQLFGGGNVPCWPGIDLEVMPADVYVAFAAARIAVTAAHAWHARQPGGIGFGLGQAVVGHNRRVSYGTGETRMYGQTNDPAFSHIEGYEDHTVHVLATWDAKQQLTGVVVNVACPSQVSENAYTLSADYWHETRQALRTRLGEELFVLAQCSAAGDQSPHLQVYRDSEQRMWRLAGQSQRQAIGERIADAVAGVLPMIAQEIAWEPVLAHRVEQVPLMRRALTPADVEQASQQADALRERYEALKAELAAHPELREQPRWYVPITAAYRQMRWYGGVAERYARQQTEPAAMVELHAVRLGDVAFATNPFELFLDYGLQIKARSAAVQTFVVQLVGSGTYLPTPRAIAGQSYGAVPASTPIGPEGGHELVEWTVAAIHALWDADAATPPSPAPAG